MKGLLLELDSKNYGIVLLRDGSVIKHQFDRTYPIAVGQEIVIPIRMTSHRWSIQKSVALALSLLLFIGPWSYAQTISSVYVDVNPSIRIDLNVFNRIVGYEALNADGQKVLKTAKDMKDMSVQQGLKSLLQEFQSIGYIDVAKANRVYISFFQNINLPFSNLSKDIDDALRTEKNQMGALSFVIQEYDSKDQNLMKESYLSPLRYTVEGRGDLEKIQEVFSDEAFDKTFHSEELKTGNEQKSFSDFDDAIDTNDDDKEQTEIKEQQQETTESKNNVETTESINEDKSDTTESVSQTEND